VVHDAFLEVLDGVLSVEIFGDLFQVDEVLEAHLLAHLGHRQGHQLPIAEVEAVPLHVKALHLLQNALSLIIRHNLEVLDDLGELIKASIDLLDLRQVDGILQSVLSKRIGLDFDELVAVGDDHVFGDLLIEVFLEDAHLLHENELNILQLLLLILMECLHHGFELIEHASVDDLEGLPHDVDLFLGLT